MAMARINARVEQEYLEKLEILKNQKHSSITQILKFAIDAYYDAHITQAQNQRQALLNGGFIACCEGDEGLSESYKKELSDALAAKHDYR